MEITQRYKKRWSRNIISTILILILVALFLFPLYYMIVASFKSTSELYGEIRSLIPTSFKWFNYSKLFSRNNVLLWFLNSILISTIVTVVVLLTNIMAGYSLAKKKFYGSNLMFWIIMGTLMLPRQVLIVPMYIMMKNLNLMGTYPSLMLPAIGWPVGIFLARQFLKTLPNEIIESAKMDGCNEIQTFFKIIIPLSKPVIGAIAIFTFTGVWNDYLWQLVIISNKNLTTLPLGVALLQNEFVPDYGMLFAGATIAAVPMITVFLIFQKAFTKGITLGAVKG